MGKEEVKSAKAASNPTSSADMKEALFSKKKIIIGVLLVGLLIAILVLKNRKRVYNFDSCEKAGYPVRLLNCQGCPKYCDAPWGETFSKSQK